MQKQVLQTITVKAKTENITERVKCCFYNLKINMQIIVSSINDLGYKQDYNRVVKSVHWNLYLASLFAKATETIYSLPPKIVLKMRSILHEISKFKLKDRQTIIHNTLVL